MKDLIVNGSDVLAMQLARELSEKYDCRCNVIGNGDETSPEAIRILAMQRPQSGIGGVLVGEDIIVAEPTSQGYAEGTKLVVIETGRSKPRKERREHSDVLAALAKYLGLEKYAQAA
jgi:hypothetical protein